MNAEAAFCLVNSHHGIFRNILALAIAQIEQLIMIKAAAKRPFAVEHCFHQFIFAINPGEGKCPDYMIH
jgi:hypothetical protein